MRFKVGTKVKGMVKYYNPTMDKYYPNENNTPYCGTISRDFEDGSYLVTTLGQELLIELYYGETMELEE